MREKIAEPDVFHKLLQLTSKLILADNITSDVLIVLTAMCQYQPKCKAELLSRHEILIGIFKCMNS